MIREKLLAQPGCGAGELPEAQSLLAALSEGGYDICKEISSYSFQVPRI